MRGSFLDLIGYIFGIWGFFIILYTVIKSKKNRPKFQIIFFINVFYAIIYGFAPSAICLYVYNNGGNENPFNYISFTTEGIHNIILFLVASIVGFVGINFGYRIKTNTKVAKSIHVTKNGVRIAAFLLMLIGWGSLYLWTKVYGGPIGILPYANALRAGWDIGIYNPWSFMMKLCPFLQLATYMFFSQFLTSKNKTDLLMTVFSGIGAFLYILANSSRMHFGLFFVILVLIYAGHHKMSKKMYFLCGVVGVLSLAVMHMGESIMGVLQNDTVNRSSEVSLNVIEIIRSEFFFPMSSFQTYMENIGTGKIGIRIVVDIENAFFSWLPSRFKPSNLVGLEATNTILHSGTTIYGGLPTDFITTCFYELGSVGLFIFPAIYGYLAKIFEKKIRPFFSNDYFKVIYVLGVFYFVKAIGYGDPANIMSNIFFLVWGHIFTTVIGRFTIGRK